MSVLTDSLQFTCTCPICGVALAITSNQPGFDTAIRAYDLAEDVVLHHLLAIHEPSIENSPVVALGVLALAGAHTLRVSGTDAAEWR